MIGALLERIPVAPVVLTAILLGSCASPASANILPSNRCGLQCLAYLALRNEQPAAAMEVLKLPIQHPDGLSLAEMEKIAANIGMRLLPTQVNEHSLASYLERDMILIMLNRDEDHYVIVEAGSSDNTFRMVDLASEVAQDFGLGSFREELSDNGLLWLTPETESSCPALSLNLMTSLSFLQQSALLIILLTVPSYFARDLSMRRRNKHAFMRRVLSRVLSILRGNNRPVVWVAAICVGFVVYDGVAGVLNDSRGDFISGSEAIPMEEVAGLFVVDVVLNDQEAIKLLVDTGAAISVLNPSLVEMDNEEILGPIMLDGIGGLAPGVGLRLERLAIGPLKVNRPIVAVSRDDMQLPSGVQGILGYDILSHWAFLIDPAGLSIHFAEPGHRWGTKESSFRIVHDRNLPHAGVSTGGLASFLLVVDTGFSGELILTDSPASRGLIDSGGLGWWRQIYTGVGGDLLGQEFPLQDLEIFGRSLSFAHAMIPKLNEGESASRGSSGRIGIGAVPLGYALGISPSKSEGWVVSVGVDPGKPSLLSGLKDQDNVDPPTRAEWARRNHAAPNELIGDRVALSLSGFEAASEGDLIRIDALISAGWDFRERRADGVTPLLLAAERGHTPVVQRLIDAGAEANVAGEHYGTPIATAAYHGHLAVLKILLDADVSPNATGDRFPSPPPLFAAAQGGHASAIKLLIEAGADLETRAPNGYDPLFLAAASGHLDAVNTLLSLGLDPRRASTSGRSPVDLALEKGFLEVAEVLLDHPR